MLKTLLVISSLQWGMWGDPYRPLGSPSGPPASLPTPSSQVSQALLKGTPSGKHWAKPRAWCGWYMRKRLGVAHPSYNRARTWAKWGSPTQPRVGAVVVWPNHVGQIVGQDQKGRWLIVSGNDSNKVRTRVWNLSKVIAYRI